MEGELCHEGPNHVAPQPHAGAPLHTVEAEQVLLGLARPLHLGDPRTEERTSPRASSLTVLMVQQG